MWACWLGLISTTANMEVCVYKTYQQNQLDGNKEKVNLADNLRVFCPPSLSLLSLRIDLKPAI